MSETAEDRSKREYLALHRSHQWKWKHCIFYAHPEESTTLLTDMVAFKQLLRRQCPSQPFLIRIQTLYKPYMPLQAYLVIYTTAEVTNLQGIADKGFPKQIMNCWGEGIEPEKLEESARSIEKQKPHDLRKFFKEVKVRRYSVLNRPLIDETLRYAKPSEEDM